MDQIQQTEQATTHNHIKPKKQMWRMTTSQWVSLLAAIGCTLLYMALPARILPGPDWLSLLLVGTLILPILVLEPVYGVGSHLLIRILTYAILGIITFVLITGVILLVLTLPNKTELQAKGLLQTGAVLWIANILVFSLWYWIIDGGGPYKRFANGKHTADFRFPQQTDGTENHWLPHYLDYLFIAFTGTTTLGPADTVPLTVRAKGLMMLQAITALIIVTVIIGRGINIL